MAEHEKIDWMKKLNSLPPARYSLPSVKSWKEIYHLIVIPMYKESLEVIQGNLKALVSTDYPKDKMIVVLACEERAREQVQGTAEEIKKEFENEFFKLIITWHPAGMPGEIAGKGSNEAWASKKAKEEIIDLLKIPYENIIFSSFDVDTCVFPKYFSCLTYHYLISKKPTRTSFQPVPLFINNIWQAPVISRIFSFSSTFWHTMNQERPEKLVTFSSHSMSFQAIIDVGFKQTNVVSDDSRIFWQCFLRYDGDYRTQPLYYPISMDANAAKNFFKTLINIYKQQKRWAYGVGDIAYFLFGFYKDEVDYFLRKRKAKTLSYPRPERKIPFLKKISLGFELIEGHFSWATASIMIFFLGWLPLILGGPEFSRTLISYNLPKIISRVMTFAMVGLVSSAYLSFLLLPPRPPDYGRFKYIVYGFSWLLFPIMMVFFTALPALDAQTRWLFGDYMGFWVTDKFRKKLRKRPRA